MRVKYRTAWASPGKRFVHTKLGAEYGKKIGRIEGEPAFDYMSGRMDGSAVPKSWVDRKYVVEVEH